MFYFPVARTIAKVPFIPGHECVGEVSIKNIKHFCSNVDSEVALIQ